MKRVIVFVVLAGFLASLVGAAEPDPQFGRGTRRDPQKKFGMYYEPGVFRDQNPATPDQPFVGYTVWDGNDFVFIGAFNTLTIDLAAAPGSSPSSVVFWEYADDSECSGNKKRVDCTATEHVFFVGNPVPLVQPIDWQMTDLQRFDAALAFTSDDVSPGVNGADSVTRPVESRAVCLQALALMRTLVDASAEEPGVRLGPSLCNGLQ